MEEAPDGAEIALLPGEYEPFDLVAKTLRIIGSDAEETVVRVPESAGSFGQGVRVRQLELDDSVFISSVTFACEASLSFSAPVSVESCTGRVTFHDCILQAPTEFNARTLWVQSCERVNLSQSGVLGYSPGGAPGIVAAGGAAIEVLDSALDVNHGALIGGSSSAPGLLGSRGGIGLKAEGSTVQLHETVTFGGNAVLSSAVTGDVGGSPGIEARDSLVRISGALSMAVFGGSTQLQVGPGTLPGASAIELLGISQMESFEGPALLPGTNSEGVPEPAVFLGPQSRQLTYAGRRAGLRTVAGLVTLGGSFFVELRGTPGAFQAYALSLEDQLGAPLPGYSGQLFLSPDSLQIYPGNSLDGSGVALISVGVPPDPLLAGLTGYFQCLELNAPDGPWLSLLAAVQLEP